MVPSKSGTFVTFEGIDGSGKSTQSRRLVAHLKSLGHDVVATREPGGAPGAEMIRKLLVEGDPGLWSPETEILLFTAARRDHMERVILPALERGAIVVSDRFADSTRIYQGAVRGALREQVDLLHDAFIGIEPDLTFVIDMDPDAALARGLARQSGEDRFEALGADFQKALREGFRDLAQSNARFALIDGTQGEDAVARDVSATWEARYGDA